MPSAAQILLSQPREENTSMRPITFFQRMVFQHAMGIEITQHKQLHTSSQFYPVGRAIFLEIT